MAEKSSSDSVNSNEFFRLSSEEYKSGQSEAAVPRSEKRLGTGSSAKPTVKSDIVDTTWHSARSDNDRSSLQSNNRKTVSMRDGKRCLVKLSLVLHISNQSVDRLLSIPVYTAQVLTVLTSSRHHPKHGCRIDTADVTVTYDSHGHMVMIEVPYIEEGIYRVVFSGDPKPHQVFKMSTTRQAQFVWTESLDKIPAESRFIILGKICQVPVPRKSSKCPLQMRLLDFLRTTNFREFTLPILLGYGEPNIWSGLAGCEKVSPVFLPGTPDYHTWKWLDNVNIPLMKSSGMNKGRAVEEPSAVPDNLPFCHYIYRTYIGRSDQQDDPLINQTETSAVHSTSECQPTSQNSTIESGCGNSSVTTKLKSEFSKKYRRHMFGKRRKDRSGFVLNIKSLCGTSLHLKDASEKKGHPTE